MAKGIMRSTKTRDGIAAALAYNLGDLEEDQYQIREEWAAQHSAFSDMQVAMEQAGLRVLNRPNLLNQHWWTTGTGVEHPVVYGKDARISGTSYPYLTSYNSPTETTQTTAPTAEQKAAATSIWAVEENGVTTYHIFVDDDDIRASVASLAAADQISETDGETYDKAIQFDISANSAYGNMEWLLYCNPYNTRVYNQGDTNVRNYGQIEEMQPGHRYSLSCWVRVLSGDGAWMKMGYGNSFTNQPYNDTTNQRSGVSDWIKIEPLNGAWQRISWTFDFNPVGDWYTETTSVVDGVTKVTRTYNWFKKVGFGFGRKFTAQVQVCGFRLVEGRTYVNETYDDLEEDVNSGKDRLTALEVAVPAAKSALLAIIAESDSATATANHAVGDLFVMGDVLYKTTAAIAIGETITPGTNCDATTIAAEIEAAASGGASGAVGFGVCYTAAATGEKTVSIDGWTLEAGAMVCVQFANTDTAYVSQIKLNVNSTGAKMIYYSGSRVPSGFLSAYNTYLMVYDGEVFRVVGMYQTGRDGSTVGANSLAYGEHVQAAGSASQAFGYQTIARGSYSHAEGNQAIAHGSASHAEGAGSVAAANASHAEGTSNVALSSESHVSGRYNLPGAGATVAWASGVTFPRGAVVKSDGRLYLCIRQHISGRYTGSFNVKEYGDDGTTLYTVWDDLGAAGTTEYAEIIGNGTPSVRSNARTLDWRGNEWLAGNLTLGNTTLTEAQLQALLALLS